MREWLNGKTGLILIEWARLIEDDMLPLVNNNVIIVESPERQEFLQNRGVSEKISKVLGNQQLSPDEMEEFVQKQIKKTGVGRVVRYCNERGKVPSNLIELSVFTC
jgi:hypothetical protein